MTTFMHTPLMRTRLVRTTLRGLNNLGHSRQCPLCGWSGFRFKNYVGLLETRLEAECPSCHSLERHRGAKLLLSEELGAGHYTLHVAPAPPVERWLRGISREYLSIDLMAPAMRKMDLTDLELPDQCMTLVWCSHVLEHIPDDRRAMAQMYRVLRPGGRAVIQVPVKLEQTYEDFSITSEEGRLRAFGQVDHVRLYGGDVVDRLRDAGFQVHSRNTAILPEEIVRRHGAQGADLFECIKE